MDKALHATLWLLWAAAMPVAAGDDLKTPFVLFDTDFDVSGPTIEYTNVPPVKSQAGFREGCFAMIAGAYLDILNCKYEGKDCRNLSDSEAFSRLDLARFTMVYPDQEELLGPPHVYDDMLPDNSGLSATNIVQNIVFTKSATTVESCASLPLAIRNFTDDRSAVPGLAKKWDKLRQTYNAFHQLEPNCPECQASFVEEARTELGRDFILPKDPKRLRKALEATTYGRFLQRFLVPLQCQRQRIAFNGPDGLTYGRYPMAKQDKADLTSTITVIKKVLSTQHIPLIISGLCLDETYRDFSSCKQLHNIMITGYRKMCAGDECRPALKVYNSWGEDWQRTFHDGWVDAEHLLDRTGYRDGFLGWMQALEPDSPR